MPYRIALVEDNPTQLQAIMEMTTRFMKEQAIPCTLLPFKSAFDTVDLSCDAYLMDIHMPGVDGIRLAQQVRTSGNMCSIIFISSIEERVFEALRVQPLRFVRKQHLTQELPEALTALCRELQQASSNSLLLSAEGEMLRVPIKRVLYVETANKFQRVVLADQTHEVRLTMQQLESQLAPQGFMRIHRCYLVNVSAIYSISAQEVTLDNGTRLPISRHKVEEAKERLKKVMFQ